MEARPPLDYSTQRGFASTHWTTVRACAGNNTAARSAREELCRDYWYPLYAYIRRTGLHNNDAEDLTQDFFAHILTRPWFIRADRSKGKFRSFLLASLKNFLRDCSDRNKSIKRGGEFRFVPLDMGVAESRYALSAASSIDPVQTYETEWVSAVVTAALKQVEHEYAVGGRRDYFDQLKIFLTTEGNAAVYETAAQSLGTTVTNIKACVHRLRRRYGAILREEVARTVGSLEDVEGEMHCLRAVLASACAA